MSGGSDYVAVTTLTDQAGTVLAEPGETCEKVPVSSLGWLCEQGYIVPGPRARASRRTSQAGAKTAGDGQDGDT